VTAIALALASSLAYGASDFLGGLRTRQLPLIAVLLVSQLAALAALLVVAVIVWPELPAGDIVVLGVVAGVAEAAGIAALYRGLSAAAMSNAAASVALAPVVPLVAAAALGELPSALQGAGLVIALAGIVALAVGTAEGSSPGRLDGLGWGLLAAATIGSYMLAMDSAAEGGVLVALVLARITTVGIVVGIVAVRRPRLELGRSDLGSLALIGLTMLAADALYAAATTIGLLSIVSVLSSLYPAVTILIARVVLEERLTRSQVAALVVTFAGVAAVAAG